MRNFERVAITCACFGWLAGAALITGAVDAQAPAKAVPSQGSAPAAAKAPAKSATMAPAAKSPAAPSANPNGEPFTIEQVLSFSFPETTSTIAAT